VSKAVQNPYVTQELSPQTSALAPNEAGDAMRRERTILVAEDDADIRLMMSTLLGMKGFRVVEASDGQRRSTWRNGNGPMSC